jgi:predicted NAD/FAD-binding protein
MRAPDDLNASDDRRMQIGVIGAGAAGLTTTWLLEEPHALTLFEKRNRLGGHAETIQVERDGELIAVDAGFEFYSERMYPNFYRLLKLLRVPLYKHLLTVTFSTIGRRAVTLVPPFRNGKLIRSGLTPRSLSEMLQLARVLSRAEPLMKARDTSITLEQFLDGLSLSPSLKEHFIYPFLLAGWCVDPNEFRQFIAYDVLRYPFLHRPSGLTPAYWAEVVGGTQAYIKALAQDLKHTRLMQADNITSITRDHRGFRVRGADGSKHEFDQLVVATNASEACELLAHLDGAQAARDILRQIEYFSTTIAVHGDRRLMPAQEKHWSVANIRYDGRHSQNTIWKPWKSKLPIFKSWITYESHMPEPLYAAVTYQHPKVNRQYFDAQRHLAELQGKDGLWFAGMYTHDVDSHESAVTSGIKVAQKLAPQSTRLKHLLGTPVHGHAPATIQR